MYSIFIYLFETSDLAYTNLLVALVVSQVAANM